MILCTVFINKLSFRMIFFCHWSYTQSIKHTCTLIWTVILMEPLAWSNIHVPVPVFYYAIQKVTATLGPSWILKTHTNDMLKLVHVVGQFTLDGFSTSIGVCGTGAVCFADFARQGNYCTCIIWIFCTIFTVFVQKAKS